MIQMVKIDRSQVMTRTPYSNKGKNHKTVIVLHETANRGAGADARAHHRLQWNGNSRQASWHYQVDDKQAIQSFSEDLRLWHAGGTAIPYTIAIEMCVNSDGNYNKMIQNAIELVKDIADRNKITSNNIVTHKFYTGKNCPTILLSGSTGWTYQKFINAVEKARTGKGTAVPPKQPAKSKKSITQLANEVIAGKHGSGSARMHSLGERYEAVQEKVNQILSGDKGKVTAQAKQEKNYRKTDQQLADEVVAGKHGTGAERRRSLGSRYNAVQNIVNQRYGQNKKVKQSVDTIAREVIRGEWGNGADRERRLRKAGYNPRTIQNRVNQLL